MTPARFEYYRNPNYLTWLRAEASEIDTDGCSGVSGIRVECCYQHDLEFKYGKDAHDAYRQHKKQSAQPWVDARPIEFGAANAKFRRCLQARSYFGMWSPLALWRWLGVKFLPKSRNAWKAHRERDARAQAEAWEATKK